MISEKTSDFVDSLDGLLIAQLLCIVSSSVFLFAAPFRLWSLRTKTVKIAPNSRGRNKVIIACLVPLTSLASLIIKSRSDVSPLAVTEVVLSIVVGMLLPALTIREHRRSLRPSPLIELYLLLMLLGATVEITYPQQSRLKKWSWSEAPTVLELLSRSVLLLLEIRDKRDFLLPEFAHVSPADTGGLVNRTLFLWMRDLLVAGNKRTLRSDDIPDLDDKLGPEDLSVKMLDRWNRREQPETKFTLLRVLIRNLIHQIMAASVPRILVVFFRCSQPLLIEWAIRFVSGRGDSQNRSSEGYWLLFTTCTVYIGLTITDSIEGRRSSRLRVMIRESLISLVYNKTLTFKTYSNDTSRAVTLMSSDVNEIAMLSLYVQETWAMFFELVIGVVLLARQIGWLFLLPMFIIFLGTQASKYVSENIKVRQKLWTMATQKRISVLSAILGSMKCVKAAGFTKPMSNYVSGLRDDEIAASKYLRWVTVIYNASANVIGIFTPVLTVVLFAVIARMRGQELDLETAFSTIAILAVVTTPANMVLTWVPRIIAAMGNVERVQTFLLEPSFESQDIQTLTTDSNGKPRLATKSPSTVAIRIVDASLTLPSQSSPVLQDINLTCARGSVTICAGPTASGKSLLCRAILGEASLSAGRIERSSTELGFCAQNVWLPLGTIKENVSGFSDIIDERRYLDAIKACHLGYDINQLPNGHNTRIGSRGINLSGGQRQRVALARLVYSGNDIVVLDDPFTALDGDTENKVVKNLLGQDGIFRKQGTTVILVSNASQHFHHADYIILLGDGTIKQQGSWKAMEGSFKDMHKFSFNYNSKKEDEVPAATTIAKAQQTIDSEQDIYRKTGDFSLYAYYLKAAGIGNFLLLATCAALYSFCTTFNVYWLKLWTEDRDDGPQHRSSTFYMTGYVLFALIAWAATSTNMWSHYILLNPRSGKVLHDILLRTIMAAPLAFFTVTDIGVTLNRFSQDIGYVDKTISNALAGLVVQIFKILTQISVIFTVQKELALSLPICLVLVYFVQKIYLRTSRQLRVLEIEASSSLYSWDLETSEGTMTIRAFGWESAAEKKNLANLRKAMRPQYALTSLQLGLSMVLELIVSGLAIGLIAIAVYWRGSTSGGDIGTALNVILVTNSTLVRLVASWAQMETSLGAVARIKNIEENAPQETENPEEKITLLPNWPNQGHLSIRGLTAGYSAETSVLKDINLEIKAGQKLVICGRTGCGKSTTILALLRLINISSGTVQVDGVDFSHVSLSDIRSRCFITVPQDSLILPDADLRMNLDPTSLASDETLQEALTKVELWNQLSSTPSDGKSPLDQKFSELSTLSVGQMQLFAMARAIVQKHAIGLSIEFDDASSESPRPVLILDEATSSLDAETEGIVYDVIEREFTSQGHTVIIIAHRLSAVAGRMRKGVDTVAWLQDGKVVKVGEYDSIMALQSD